MDLENALKYRAQVEEFRRRHRTGLVTLVFTDLVGSTQLKGALGDHAGVALIQSHHALVRDVLKDFAEAEEISTAGDSFFIVFVKPSDAVRFALSLQAKLRALARGSAHPLRDRIGIHIGEVVIEEREGMPKPKDLYGMQVDICARVMGLASADQVLLTRAAFDNARQVLKGEDIPDLGQLTWLNHGPYILAGLEEPLEICEVGETGSAALKPPADVQKAQRKVSADEEPVLGWRPALGQVVPNTKWELEQKLGEGGFGEVWVGRHQAMKERRVFKFCFRADRVRSLKREMTLFRLIKERIGDHRNIVSLREVYFDQPPFYVEEDYVAGQDLKSWCEAQGGPDKTPLETKLEIIAQVADALQAAHDAGVIHRDIKPANILVSDKGQPLAKLTDFGIGQVVSQEHLSGITKAGFTQTILGPSSSSHTGTQLYMAPELLAGKPASTRSDIYSLGVVLYQVLINDFSRPVTMDWADQVPDALLREDLKHCFAGDPQARFSAAEQVAQQIRSLPERHTARERRLAEKAAGERAAYRRGIIRATSLAGGVVILLVTLSIIAFNQSRRAKAAAESERRQIYAVDMNLAQQALLDDDLGKARKLLSRYNPGTGLEHLRSWEWRYLAAEARSDYTIEDNSSTSVILNLALSPDGRLLALRRYGGTVELWDAVSLIRLTTLQKNEGGQIPTAATLAFSPKGNLLAMGAREGIIRLWQLEPRQVLGELVNTNQIYPRYLAFSPDGRHLAALYSRLGVWVWNVETHQPVKCPSDANYQGLGAALCFSPDGQYLASGDDSGHIRILDWSANRVVADIAAYKKGNQGITALAYSPDGKMLASGSGVSPDEIRLWNPATGESVGALPGQRAWISALRFTGDGRQLLSASADQTIGIWDVATRRQARKLRGHLDEVWSLALDEHRNKLFSGSKDGSLARWDLSKLEPGASRLELPGRTSRPAWAEGGSCVAVLDQQGAVALWRPGEPQMLSRVTALGTNNSALTASVERGLLACAHRDGPIQVWSLLSGSLVTNLNTNARYLRFSKREDSLLAWEGSRFTVWDAKAWIRRCSLVESNAISCGALSPHGTLLVLGSGVGKLFWWDTVNGCRLAEMSAHRMFIQGLDFSPDGQTLASVSGDGTVALWNTTTHTQTAQWRASQLGVHSVAFSQDGRRLATGLGGNDAVRLWDMQTLRELITLPLPKTGMMFYTVEFSPDNEMVLGRSEDGRSYVWRVPSFQEIQSWKEREEKEARERLASYQRQ